MRAPDRNSVYLDDAALLLLAAPGEWRDRLLERLVLHVQQEGAVYTSAAAFETVQEFFLARSNAVQLRQYWNALDGLFREILPLRGEDLGRALDILESSPTTAPDAALRPAQALHAAIVLNHRVEWMVDPEHRYATIPGIKAFEF